MSTREDLLSKIAELEAEVKAREESEARAQAEARQLAIDSIRALESGEVDLFSLLEVCEQHGVKTVADLGAIFRSRRPKAEMDQEQVERVQYWIKRNRQSTAEQIVEATNCDPDLPRRMAAKGLLMSYGKARGTRYSIGR